MSREANKEGRFWFSDKAEALKQKVIDDNKRKGNPNAKVELLWGAGVIVYWVLLKRRFEGLGWIKKGRFFEIEGVNTALLAANWMTHLSGDVTEEINPLAARICGIWAEDMKKRCSDEMLEQHLRGTLLEDSIDDAIEELLSLWPIVRQTQEEEFKELFLQREAVISETSVGWKVFMVKEPYDALIERTPIPWPMTMISFPWINEMMEVEWM